MKFATKIAKAMTDKDLFDTALRLRKEIPAAQSLLSAVKYEIRRRKKKNV